MLAAGDVASISYGRGDGSFDTPVRESVQVGFAADLNGDGLVDLLAVYPDGVARLYRGPIAGPAGPAFAQVPASWHRQISAGDLDGDRHVDLILIDAGTFGYHGTPVHGDGPYPTGRVLLFRGRGDGTFEPARMVLSERHISDMSIGDFNGDGYVDLVLTQPSVYVGAIVISYGTADGGFATPRFLAYLFDPGWIITAHAAGDVNADGFDDLVLQTAGVVSYFYGTPGGLLLRGNYVGADVPYIARRSSSRFPRVVYSSVPGELVVLENECVPVRRRGVRH